MPPALFLLSAENQLLLFVPNNLADDKDKDDFATTARLVCIAHGATVSVMALESWMTCATPDQPLDMDERSSEAIDRREVIVLLGEARGVQRQKFLPILRSDNGKFFGLGESDVPSMDSIKGRFAQILPPQMPDQALREVALAMLKVKGVGKARPHGGQRPSRPRF